MPEIPFIPWPTTEEGWKALLDCIRNPEAICALIRDLAEPLPVEAEAPQKASQPS